MSSPFKLIISIYHLFSLVTPFKIRLVAFNAKQGGKIKIHMIFNVKIVFKCIAMHLKDTQILFYPVFKQFNVMSQTDSHYSTDSEYIGPIDQSGSGAPVRTRRMNTKLISHQMADKFKASAHNIPWIKDPVCYIEDGYLYIVYDSYDAPQKDFVEITYIKAPNKFAKDLDKLGDISELWKNINHSDFTLEDLRLLNPTTLSYFFWSNDTSLENVNAGLRNAYHALATYLDSIYTFECNDTMAEELISLAVSFALENVESQRLNSKLNMRGLEA